MNDRRVRATLSGLYAVTPDLVDTGALVNAVQAALEGGARVVQYRNKGATPDLRLHQAQAVVDVCNRHGRPLIVNDDVDIAAAVNAAGVHIGREDSALTETRAKLGPQKIIGVSCYDSLDRARAAVRGGADYVAFGSFFPSRVKPNAVRATLDLLRAARAEIDVPIVAIGGITAENAPQLIDAGADAVAVISAVFSTPDVAAASRRFVKLFDVAQR